MTTFIRVVLLVALIAFTHAAVFAQTQPEPRRIGLLSSISSEEHAINRRALLEGLEERGYVDGKNIAIEYRYANGDRGRLTELATELVDLDVDLIIAVGPPTIAAAMQATSDIPIIMVSGGDVVGRGFVANLAQPGGNVTGLHSLSKSSGKRLMLLKEAFPSLSRVAVLNARKRKHTVKAYQRHAKRRGIDMQVVNIRKAEELDEAFARIRAARPHGLLVVRSPLTSLHATEIADFAIEESQFKQSAIRNPTIRNSSLPCCRPGAILQPAQHVAQRADLNRVAVHVGDGLIRIGRHTLARGENADQVQGVGAGNDDRLGIRSGAAYGTHGFDCIRQGILLAHESVHEAAAANLAARLEPPIGLKQEPPGRGAGLTSEELTENNTVPL